jgi:alanine racemase
MLHDVIRPTTVEIDLEALRENAATIAEVTGRDLYAVVKADAYGHGAVAVAAALADSPHVAGFAVSLVEEGVQLRDAGIACPILIMGPAQRDGLDEIVARDMLAMVSERNDFEGLSAIGRVRTSPVRVHIKVDTGMTRLGFRCGDLPGLIRESHSDGGVQVTGIATHLACADIDDPDDPSSMTARQLDAFDESLAAARSAGASPDVIHAANSSGALLFPRARYDRVRCGIALYGNGNQPPGKRLAQVMRLRTQVAQLRRVDAGSSVSYGSLWTAPAACTLAILPCGYADGLPRRLTGSAEVLIGGRRCPIVGAISMDIAVADVTALGDAVAVGDEAVLLGSQAGEHIAVSELASRAGITEYEVTCGVSKRVPRVHR